LFPHLTQNLLSAEFGVLHFGQAGMSCSGIYFFNLNIIVQ
jgi:hypothetical protein